MADELRIGLAELLCKARIEHDADFLMEGVRILSQALMEMESQEFHHGHRRQGLLLRSQASLAARHLREYQQALPGQYLPRKSDLSVYGQHDLDLIALKLNSRPRKTLGYSTPAATLARTVALTG